MSVVECDIPFCSLSFFVISWEVVNVCHIILNRLNKDDLFTSVCFCVCVCSPQRASTSSASDIYCTRWRTAARQTASPSINTLLSPTRLWVSIVKHTHTLYINMLYTHVISCGFFVPHNVLISWPEALSLLKCQYSHTVDLPLVVHLGIPETVLKIKYKYIKKFI